NGMQRFSYTGVLALAPLLVFSGLAMYKPVQFPRLTALVGGYDAARAIHLIVTGLLALFAVVHITQVLRHPRTLLDMSISSRQRTEGNP
ncbi:MAG TPA: cytochrome b/b6 domain-containing protein, partial [Anaeromyxobacteraceae bacterium]|nr:cytochrome b/b6 domain-containing protein [Anaeromyxobacteraceae bacterium]